jgi:hypothetical protein
VIIVLGILVLGAAGGAGLIRSAKVNGIMGESREIKTAVNTFSLYRGRLPGDANNDGRIDPNSHVELGDGSVVDESLYFWRELADYGLVGNTLRYNPESDPGAEGNVVGVNIPASGSYPRAGWQMLYSEAAGDNALILTGFDGEGNYVPLIPAKAAEMVKRRSGDADECAEDLACGKISVMAELGSNSESESESKSESNNCYSGGIYDGKKQCSLVFLDKPLPPSCSLSALAKGFSGVSPVGGGWKKCADESGPCAESLIQSKSSLQYGNIVRISACVDGYRLEDNPLRYKCSESASWKKIDSTDGKCVRTICPEFSQTGYNPIAEGTLTGESKTPGCMAGYAGTPTLSCGINGNDGGLWSLTAGSCAQIVCPTASYGVGYKAFASTKTYGQSQTTTCATGYAASATPTFRCDANGASVTGKWTLTAGSCYEAPCVVPAALSNGVWDKAVGSSVNHGGTITQSCGSGYKLSGTARVGTCNGGAWSWNNTNTECNQPPKCPALTSSPGCPAGNVGDRCVRRVDINLMAEMMGGRLSPGACAMEEFTYECRLSGSTAEWYLTANECIGYKK